MNASIYPYDKWFKKKSFTLEQGKDYRCTPNGMSKQLRTAASNRGLRASIHVEGTTIKVSISNKEEENGE